MAVATDKEFLQWIHDRLINVHGENEHFDYMHKLRAVIFRTPVAQGYSPAANSDLSLDAICTQSKS